MDGAPVNGELVQVMTTFMAFRGPDSQNRWVKDSAGFGHTLLATSSEAEREQQPCSLDGSVWITADARIDGRRALIGTLRSRGSIVKDDATDPDLILHAYGVWGRACVEHLIGDFAFAIWDSREQQLFCARDHFGIKPFFYARVAEQFVFSNTLNCIRQHPAVTSTLNDMAIADFLLFEENKDPATTAFSDIERLPSAHTLIWSKRTGFQVQRYWRLPDDLRVCYRAAGDYVEHFRFLLDQAVADRLRSNRVGIEMSGGLDSTSIAATALGILSRRRVPFELQAQAVVYDELIPDQERHFSGIAARHLGIPIHYIVADGYQLYARSGQPGFSSPEPVHNPRAAMGKDTFRGAVVLSRVFLTGWDGDALMSESIRPHFRSLAKNGQFARLAFDLLRYAVLQRGLLSPGWYHRAAGRFAKATVDAGPDDGYPGWLNPELEARLGLRNRWHQHHAIASLEHPTRPSAHSIYSYLAQSTGFFDGYDAGNSGLPLEYRHPLMDLRLLEFCLSLPLQPWLVKKYILKQAMRNVLPDRVRVRRKTPLAGSPHYELLRRNDCTDFDHLVLHSDINRYVDAAKLKLRGLACLSSDKSWLAMRPLSLHEWLSAVNS